VVIRRRSFFPPRPVHAWIAGGNACFNTRTAARRMALLLRVYKCLNATALDIPVDSFSCCRCMSACRVDFTWPKFSHEEFNKVTASNIIRKCCRVSDSGLQRFHPSLYDQPEALGPSCFRQCCQAHPHYQPLPGASAFAASALITLWP